LYAALEHISLGIEEKVTILDKGYSISFTFQIMWFYLKAKPTVSIVCMLYVHIHCNTLDLSMVESINCL